MLSVQQRRCAATVVSVHALLAGLALGQARETPKQDFEQPSAASMEKGAVLAWMKRLGIDPNSDAAREYMAQQEARERTEKELRKLRFAHFETTHAPTRAEGIEKLKQYNDPALFPLLIDIFAREDSDVRLAVLDMFASQQGPEGDAALTWEALFDSQQLVRDEAMLRMQDRLRASDGALPESAKLVLYQAFKSSNPTSRGLAAGLADTLNLVEAIPWMVTTQLQVSGGNSGELDDGRGSLAFIAVGQQTAYVSDLQPVVSDNAVGFDPQVSVINTGTVVRVDDAVVYSYNLDVHNALVRMTSRLWGQPTDELGWDYRRWMQWYKGEFTPYWTTRQNERAAGQQGVPPQNTAPNATGTRGATPNANDPQGTNPAQSTPPDRTDPSGAPSQSNPPRRSDPSQAPSQSEPPKRSSPSGSPAGSPNGSPNGSPSGTPASAPSGSSSGSPSGTPASSPGGSARPK